MKFSLLATLLVLIATVASAPMEKASGGSGGLRGDEPFSNSNMLDTPRALEQFHSRMEDSLAYLSRLDFPRATPEDAAKIDELFTTFLDGTTTLHWSQRKEEALRSLESDVNAIRIHLNAMEAGTLESSTKSPYEKRLHLLTSFDWSGATEEEQGFITELISDLMDYSLTKKAVPVGERAAMYDRNLRANDIMERLG